MKVLNNNDEHDEQKAFIQYFRLAYPRLSKRLFAIPNGGLRNIKVAKKLKAEGVMPGVADLFLMVAAGGYHGLFIEMKRDFTGRQSTSQKEFEKEVIEAGFLYVLAHGSTEAINIIGNYIEGNLKKPDGV